MASQPQALTEYERKRLDNIRRNNEMMAAFKIQSAASDLSAASKRQRLESKSEKSYPKTKQPKNETPVVLRRSLRSRGIPPDAKNVADDLTVSDIKMRPPSPLHLAPLEMIEVCNERESHRSLIQSILAISNVSPQLSGTVEEESVDDVKDVEIEDGNVNFPNAMKTEIEEDGEGVKMEDLDKSPCLVKMETGELSSGVKGQWTSSIKMEEKNDGSCLKLGSLVLNADNVARVLPGRIMTVRIFPSRDIRMIVAGNKSGEVGFWNADHEAEEGNGIYYYHPHSGPISGISIQPHALSKVYTSCYDGFIKLMDAEKEMFDLVYHNEDAVFSLAQQSNDVNCLYFSVGRGGLNIWDRRSGNCPMEWTLHEDRINTIDFNVENCNMMATSSSDGTVCIWDLRSVNAEKPQTLKTISHKRAIHSAYFSPSGRFLATTSMDDNVGIFGGANFEDTTMIPHDNQTGRWISSFRARWGWDDSYIFIGNMKRAVDVISRTERKRVFALESPHMSAIPCRFDVHPYDIGTLAGATGGGQVYMWTMSQDF